MSKQDLAKALAVTAELTGTEISEAAARVMLDDVSQYPEDQVIGALHRCRKELKGRLTIADIISRIDDGRPGPEEAWSMIKHDEASSFAWTVEMQKAYGVALPLIQAGDMIAARMAFKESYQQHVRQSRDNAQPTNWMVSLGWHKEGREQALADAIVKGRISSGHALMLLPDNETIKKLHHQVCEEYKKLHTPAKKEPELTDESDILEGATGK